MVEAGVDVLGSRPVVLVRCAAVRRAGALTPADSENMAQAAGLALRQRIPLVLSLDTAGADVASGIDSLHGWGGVARALSRCSGTVPVLAVVAGRAVSGPALLLGLADIVVMTTRAEAYVSSPSAVESLTGVRMSAAELGGAAVHARHSGVCTFVADDEAGALAVVEEVLGYLPDHTDAEPALVPASDRPGRPTPELASLIPTEEAASYDVRAVAAALVDDGELLELGAAWAPQLVTAFARLDGRACGIVANQPRALAGTLDIAASQKGARFVQLCDAFNLPIVTLVDTPGFFPGKNVEWRGMIRHGAQLAFAYAESTVPRVCVILRKAFGGAYIVMDCKGIGNDLCLALPSAQIAVMGAKGATQILHRRATEAEQGRLESEYADRFLSPWIAAERGFVDAVLDPADTRSALVTALRSLSSKRETLKGRKHQSQPL